MANRITFTENQKEEIKDLYLNKQISVTKISKLYNISPNTLSKNLKEWGCEVINRQNTTNCTDEDIINDYKAGLSTIQIGEKYKTNRHRVSKVLNLYGIKVINHQNISKFDESIFDVIDTEEKAYWLGFIFADGYIASLPDDKNKKVKYSFEISLKGSDSEHLHKFNIFMKHNKDNVKISTVTCEGKKCIRCRWGITNKHLWEVLFNYGCTPRKSNTLQFPKLSIFQSSDLIRHFIRGYFDGDGCISYCYSSKSKDKVSPICEFLGTEQFLKTIQEYLNITSYINTDKRMDNTKVLKFSPNSARELLNYLYNDCTIYLDRKFKRAQFFMQENCRSSQEWLELLASENGEGCDVNPVISEDSNKSSTL